MLLTSYMESFFLFFFQLCLFKEQANKEVALKTEAVASKNEALKQQASMEQMLHMKSEVNCQL